MEQKSPAQEPKEFKVGGAGAITTLVILTLLLMINYADRSILTIALQPIKQTFKLSDTDAGGLVSLFTLGIALFTIPVSIIGDRWARRKLVGVMAIVWSTFTLCTGLATQTWHLFVSRFMVGAGEAGYATAGVTWLAVSFSKETRAKIMSVFSIGGNLGAIIGLVIGGWVIATTHDWRMAFYIFAIPGLILAFTAFFLKDYKSFRNEDEGLFSKAYFKGWGNLFKIKSYVLSTIGISLFHFTVQAATAWTPALLMRAFKLSTLNAGLVYGGTGLATIIAALIGGYIADKWYKRDKRGRPGLVVISLVTNLIFTFVTYFFLVNISLEWFMVGLALMAFTFGLHFPPYLAIASDITPLSVRITAIGLANFVVHVFGATLGPVLAGAISDAAGGGAVGIQVGITCMVVISAVGAIIYAMMLRYYISDSSKISDQCLAEK